MASQPHLATQAWLEAEGFPIHILPTQGKVSHLYLSKYMNHGFTALSGYPSLDGSRRLPHVPNAHCKGKYGEEGEEE